VNIATKNVVSAPHTARAIDAFALISQLGISHLALESAEGFLSGNISVKDFQYCASDFHRLLLPVNDYINQVRQQSIKTVLPALHANTDATVKHTIARLATIHIHRLYLTEKLQGVTGRSYRPVGVISLRDVLTLFVN